MDKSVLIATSRTPSPAGILRRFLVRLVRLDLTGKINDVSPAMKDIGGFSDVFVGYCQCSISPTSSKKKVAVKRLRVHLKGNERFQKKFTNEIYIWSKLDHAYILPLHGFFLEDDDYPSLVSEWMENGTVLSYLNSNPECDLQQMILKIAEGLNYLHTKDVVHSDIKPENILISASGQPRICDFGISRMLVASNSFNFTQSTSGGLKGTIRYLAVELFTATGQDSCTFSKASDVWAFGMTVLVLLTRRQPYFNIALDVGVILAVSSGKLPALPEDNVGWSESRKSLWELCESCWHRSPLERPSISRIITTLRALESRVRETNSGADILDQHELAFTTDFSSGIPRQHFLDESIGDSQLGELVPSWGDLFDMWMDEGQQSQQRQASQLKGQLSHQTRLELWHMSRISQQQQAASSVHPLGHLHQRSPTMHPQGAFVVGDALGTRPTVGLWGDVSQQRPLNDSRAGQWGFVMSSSNTRRTQKETLKARSAPDRINTRNKSRDVLIQPEASKIVPLAEPVDEEPTSKRVISPAYAASSLEVNSLKRSRELENLLQSGSVPTNETDEGGPSKRIKSG